MSRTATTPVRALFMMMCLATALPVDAASAPGRTERVPALREPIYRQLSTAREHVDKENLAAAIEALDRLNAQASLNSYEKAMVWNLYAFVHYTREDYSEAATAYRNVLEQEPIPESLQNSALYSLAQLFVVTEQYDKALDALKEWFARVQSPNPAAVMLLAQVHYQLGNHAEAHEAIGNAISESESRNETVHENWYLMLRAIYYAQKDYAGLAKVLQKLVEQYPKREYWVQLSAVYGELNDEKRQLATLETAYEQKMLETQGEYVMLAQLLIANGIPFKGGKVLEAGLSAGVIEATAETQRMLADAWMLAREYERSVASLRAASTSDESGETDLRLAQVLLEMERYRDALDAARVALKKGNLEKPDTAHVVEGLALYNLDELDAAAKAFGAAERSGSASPIVSQWLDFIDKERARREALQRAMNASSGATTRPRRATS